MNWWDNLLVLCNLFFSFLLWQWCNVMIVSCDLWGGNLAAVRLLEILVAGCGGEGVFVCACGCWGRLQQVHQWVLSPYSELGTISHIIPVWLILLNRDSTLLSGVGRPKISIGNEPAGQVHSTFLAYLFISAGTHAPAQSIYQSWCNAGLCLIAHHIMEFVHDLGFKK